MHEESDFPSETTEEHGHFVGLSGNVVNILKFKILTSDTNKIIHRSSVRSAEKSDTNQRVDMGRKQHFSGDFNDRNITAPEFR